METKAVCKDDSDGEVIKKPSPVKRARTSKKIKAAKKARSDYTNRKARAERFIKAMVLDNHRIYDFNIMSTMFKSFFKFSRTMSIPKYIEVKGITNATYHEFYYLMNVIEEHRVQENVKRKAAGEKQIKPFIVTAMTLVGQGKRQDTSKLHVDLLDAMYEEILRGKGIDCMQS